MVGNPKYLNTKYDYEYVRENFDNWREYWQELLVDANAKLFRIGFTEMEVAAAIAE